jgi:hypothetical protein
MNRLEKPLTVILILSGLPAMAVNPTFATAGVALGQTLRLNVEAPPSSVCNAQLSFVDRNGQPIPTPYKTVNLNPGQADSLDISAASLGVQFGRRVELRPWSPSLQASTSRRHARRMPKCWIRLPDAPGSRLRHIAKNLIFGRDVVVVEWIFEAEHKGPFAGRPATGVRVEVPGCSVYEYHPVKRQITGGRIYFDVTTLLKQIGAA